MKETNLRGTISYVQYEKHFATIDYTLNGKAKSVNCKTNITEGGKKPHYFRVGDEVDFQLKLSDRGDKMTAYAVKFLFNPALERLIQKARHENRFSGYIKKVNDALFIKEVESYLFFPLLLSPWETHPSEQSFNTPVSFRFTHLDKPKQLSAELYFPVYIPEFREAQKAAAEKKALAATVTKRSPHAVYITLFDGKIGAKIALPAAGFEEAKEGDVVEVIITYLSASKIAVQKA